MSKPSIVIVTLHKFTDAQATYPNSINAYVLYILPKQRDFLQMQDMSSLSLDVYSIAHYAETDADKADERCPAELARLRKHNRDDVFEEISHVLQGELQAHAEQAGSAVNVSRCEQRSQAISFGVMLQAELQILQLAQIERPQPYPRRSHTCRGIQCVICIF